MGPVMRDINFRPATADDAETLVDIVLMAGEGLPDRAWAAMAGPDETLRDVGRRRAARDSGSFSYRNATLVLNADAVLGGMIGYALPDTPLPIGPDFPQEFVPLQELENLVPRSWYLNMIAVFPAARGQGVGSRLLGLAETRAGEAGLVGVSIIVFSDNTGAERLYRRAGYDEVARRKMAIPGWAHDGAHAILLVKPV